MSKPRTALASDTMKHYRDNGAIDALLDEYEKALVELDDVIVDITPTQLTTVVDHQTKDDDCRSIQSVLTHVVRAGYSYVIEIRRWLGEDVEFRERETLDTIAAYRDALKRMFRYNEQLFMDHPDIQLEEFNPEKKILVHWGQRYDVEQLYEHAIVHVLRHRRQIERFLLMLRYPENFGG